MKIQDYLIKSLCNNAPTPKSEITIPNSHLLFFILYIPIMRVLGNWLSKDIVEAIDRTDHMNNFQQNCQIMQGLNGRYQLTRTSGRLSAQLVLVQVVLDCPTVPLYSGEHSKLLLFNWDWKKMFGNWCVKMFYNLFCTIVPCSVIEVIIVIMKKPSCIGSGEFIQLFKQFD